MQSSPASCHFLSLRSKYSPQHPVLKHRPICVLPLVWETKFHTHTKTTYERRNINTLLSGSQNFRKHRSRLLSLCFNWASRHEGILGKWMYTFTHSWPSH
jgi:hypothetical protein